MYRFLFVLILVGAGCQSEEGEKSPGTGNTVFKKLSSAETGVTFENNLVVSQDFDVFRYRNFYNGGGVGIGDFNNDSLPDLYLTSNMGENKLFLNKGNWKFEDITKKAGVQGSKVWSTGVSIADVNGDGLLDIYVCNAGDVNGGNRENELFINNGDLTFTERAAEFGLADLGFTTHAAFFDFDKDNDLDCYILNNSYRPVSSLGYRNLRNVRDAYGGHKLYRNDNGKFKDISPAAGIYGSVIGFGLGVTVGDVNNDMWQDLYISNDFYERDYLYINTGKGAFKEQLESSMGHISMFSMGADLADLNNDGFPEIFSTDMLPEEDARLKTLTAFETYDVYQLRLRNGYYHQFMRNMLHLNKGDGTFLEIGQLAGVDATDWSWGALIADFDNDQYKEIFVCNGIYKDLIDQDFIEYLGSHEQLKAAIEGKKVDFRKFVDAMPSQPLSNYMFSREGELRYRNVAEEWGISEPSFSNGAAYGDLDNDGDLDLVINNVNQEVFIYRNQVKETTGNNALAITFKGTGKNTFGLGTFVKVYVNGQVLAAEHMPIRGFQSSMDYKMIIGLGSSKVADSVVVTWPDFTRQVLTDVPAAKPLKLDQRMAIPFTVDKIVRKKAILKNVTRDSIIHVENQYNDFDRDRLQYHMLSTTGPAFAKADLNKDGADDFFLGGSAGNAGTIHINRGDQIYSEIKSRVFEDDKAAEDVGAAFFDADNDGDYDLYVVSGGSENSLQSAASLDRYYENVGSATSPEFKNRADNIPAIYHSGSCVKPADIDADGDIDLFVGTRVLPTYYGQPCKQYILLNDGKGKFQEASSQWHPAFDEFGMVTDAEWFDYDNNGFSDLLIVGEWMPFTLLMNNGTSLVRNDPPGLTGSHGWWTSVHAADIDLDGDTDFIAGNLGLNSKFQPSKEAPIFLYSNDFDQNGSIDPVFAFRKGSKEYPFALRPDLIKQMSSLKKKFVHYKDYAHKSIDEILDPGLLSASVKLEFTESRTCLLINNGAAGFDLMALPIEAQFSPVYGIETYDANADGKPDIILGGNLFAVKPEVGRYDAMEGLLLLNEGSNRFRPVSHSISGIEVQGETRDIAVLRNRNSETVAFIRNNASMVFFQKVK